MLRQGSHALSAGRGWGRGWRRARGSFRIRRGSVLSDPLMSAAISAARRLRSQGRHRFFRCPTAAPQEMFSSRRGAETLVPLSPRVSLWVAQTTLPGAVSPPATWNTKWSR